MKTKLLFSKTQYCKNGFFTLLIIFMTISSFGQNGGIIFNCGGNIVEFGAPDDTTNGFPSWSSSLTQSGSFSLFVQPELTFPPRLPAWEVYGPGGPGGDILYFFSFEFVNDLPSCNVNDWLLGPNITCSLSSITCPQPTPTWYQDSDMDTFGNPLVTQISETQPTGYVADKTDCDDNDATVNGPTIYYADVDEDGFGDPASSIDSCTGAPAGFIEDNTDCDDTFGSGATIYPGATEITYDGIDNDCNPETLDDDLDQDGFVNADDCDDNDDTVNATTTYYVDADGDGYGTTAEDICSAVAPSGYATVDGDCDETNGGINPGATEILDDGIDQNCDGVDETTNNYIIIALDEIHLHGNNTVDGNIGATEDDGKVKLHDISTVSGSVEASDIDIDDDGSSAGSIILEPAVVDLPPFVFNSISDSNSPDITVEAGQTVTLNDQVYGKIEVEEGGTLIFNNSNVYIQELKTKENATVDFTGCTNLFINEKVKLEDNTSFNPSGKSVTMYVDDNVVIEEGADVTAHIYANNYIEAKGKDDNAINMEGFFSGKKVKGDESVSWQGQPGYVPCEIVEPDINEEDFCDCKGGMVSLTIAYSGTGSLTTNSGIITGNQDGTYTIEDNGEKLEKNLEISDGDGEFSNFATIHTSCSQEILNLTYDEVFTVIAYTDKEGNTCEVNYSSRVAIEEIIEDPKIDFAVSIWPNPSNNLFNVKMITPNSIDKVTIKTFDINGRLIHSNIINGNEDYQFGDQLSSGVYFVRLSQANITKVIKVIKQ